MVHLPDLAIVKNIQIYIKNKIMSKEFQISVTISPNDLASLISAAVKQGLEEYEINGELNNKEKFLTKNQIAKRLGKSPHTVKKWVDKGLIRANSSGHISEYDLMLFIDFGSKEKKTDTIE